MLASGDWRFCPSKGVGAHEIWALLNRGGVPGVTGRGGGGESGMCVARACAHAQVTQMTHLASLNPLCFLRKNQGSLRHWRVVCLSQRKNVDIEWRRFY